MCCQHRPSIMVARFVTAIATVTKLGTYVSLGDLYFETKWWCDMISGLATRGRYVKTQNYLALFPALQVSTWSIYH